MRLSVVVPGYRTPMWQWKRSVSSVLLALPSEGELVCVDDGAGMPDLDSLIYVDGRVRIIHRKNGGLSVARNTGLRICRGEAVSFVDSDDEIEPETYRDLVEKWKDLAVDIVFFGVRTVWPIERLTKTDCLDDRIYGRPTAADVATIRHARLLNYAWNKFYRRAFLQEHALEFDPNGMPCEDIIFNLRCLLSGASVASLGKVAYVYYRLGVTLLSRYQRTLVEANRVCDGLWMRYLKTKKNMELVFGPRLKGFQKKDRLRAEWENLWRIETPYTFKARVEWLREHKAWLKFSQGEQVLLRLSPWCLCMGQWVKQGIRRCLLRLPRAQWFNRCRIKRRFPTVRPWEG